MNGYLCVDKGTRGSAGNRRTSLHTISGQKGFQKPTEAPRETGASPHMVQPPNAGLLNPA